MKMRTLAVFFFALMAGTMPAAAQEHDPAAAEALFRQARDAMARRDYANACRSFAESQRLDPAAGTLLNLADCEEHLGRLASSWQHWREAADQLPKTGDERLPFAVQRAEALEKRVPRLAVRLAPNAKTGIEVRRDQISLGSASLGVPLPVDPGDHTIVVTAPGHSPRRTVITLAEGDQKEFVAELGAQIATAQVPPAPEQPHGSSTMRTTGWVVGGIGVGSLAVAGVTGLMLASKKDDVSRYCNDQRQCDPQGLDAASAGKTLITVNTVAWAVGLAGAGVGAYLVLSNRSDSKATTTIGAAPALGGAHLSLVRRF